jgi:hypothetical protein
MDFFAILCPIPDLPRSVLAPFIVVLYMFPNWLSPTPELARMLVNSCQLTSTDLADFETNPLVFLETAYPTEQCELSCRWHVASIVSYLAEHVVKLLLSQQPSEEVTFLLAKAAWPLLSDKLQARAREWCFGCLSALASPLEQSTFLYFLSETVCVLGEEERLSLQDFVIESLMSDSLVVVCNALNVMKEMMECQLTFPVEIIEWIIQTAPMGQASDVLILFLRSQRDAIVPFVQSILESACSALGGEDFEVQKSLNVIAELIQSLRDAILSGELVSILARLAAEYSDESEYGVNLAACFSAVFSTDFPGSGLLLAALVESLHENEHLLNEIGHFSISIFQFVVMKSEQFLGLEITEQVLMLCIRVFRAEYPVKMETEAAVSDLLAALIQLNVPEIEVCKAEILSLTFQEERTGWQIVSSLFLAGRIEFPVADLENFCAVAQAGVPCFYEKRLFAAALLAAVAVVPEVAEVVVPVAMMLIAQERTQREQLGNCVRCFPCSHNYTFPVESVNLTGLVARAIPVCSRQLQEQLQQLFS